MKYLHAEQQIESGKALLGTLRAAVTRLSDMGIVHKSRVAITGLE
jgi:hypothetical protein